MSPPRKTETKKKAGATTKRTPKTKTASPEKPSGEYPIVFFEKPREWSGWLSKNHASSRGVWLKMAKKGSGIASLTYPEAVEAALTWGWIDGQAKRHDDTAWIQKFTPRGPRSIWSKINREKALALIDAGKMKPPGLEQVERAKQDGRWEAAYDSPSRATVPEDLSAALAANPRAAEFFATLNASNRYAILFRVHNAKKAETRARRIAQFVELLARHEKLHP